MGYHYSRVLFGGAGVCTAIVVARVLGILLFRRVRQRLRPHQGINAKEVHELCTRSFKPSEWKAQKASGVEGKGGKHKVKKGGGESSSYDAIVIGAGIGGLTTASTLAQQGWKVLVLEQHDRIGGATHVFELNKPARPQPLPFLSSEGDMDAPTPYEAEWDAFPATCEFDTGYHYTCWSFSDIRSRAGGILAYACGRSCLFSDLGDPFDRAMFPSGGFFNKYSPEQQQQPKQKGEDEEEEEETDEQKKQTSWSMVDTPQNALGLTEYRFVRGKAELVDTLLDQLLTLVDSAPQGDKEAIRRVLRPRLLLFNKMCHDAARSASKLFQHRATPFYRWPVIGPLFDRWGCQALNRYGTLRTAYVIRAVIEEGFSQAEVLSKRPLSSSGQHALAQIDGTLSGTMPLEADYEHWSATTQQNYREVLRRALALMVHPIGDYAAQPRESSFLAHGFVVNYYRYGSSYPQQSAQWIGAGMAHRVREAGGDCLCNATVSSIILDEKTKSKAVGVNVHKTGANPATEEECVTIKAKHIVNAAGIYHLYHPERGFLSQQRPDLSERFRHVSFRPSMSHMYLFVVLRGTPKELELDRTNLWCLQGEGYRNNAIDPAYDHFLTRKHLPLSTHPNSVPGSPGPGWESSANTATRMSRTESADPYSRQCSTVMPGFDAAEVHPQPSEERGARPPAVYITFPCAKQSPSEWKGNSNAKQNNDTDGRSEGPTTPAPISNAILFCDARYSWFEAWKHETVHHRGGDYESLKRRFAQMLFSVLLEKRPDLRDKVLWYEVGTPLTSEHYLGAYHGADYGTRVDCNYFSKRSLEWLMRADTPIENLWQSGQDAMTPSISGALHGGLLCSLRMLGLAGSFDLIWDLIAFKAQLVQEENKVKSRWSAIRIALGL